MTGNNKGQSMASDLKCGADLFLCKNMQWDWIHLANHSKMGQQISEV